VDKVRSDGVLKTYQTVKTRLEERNAIGYSAAGVVLAVGDLAEGFEPGNRVACGGGHFANHAEIDYVPSTLCVSLPDEVGFDEAAFATVGAVALQGVRQAQASLGDRVAVIGLGLVGLLTVQLLRAAGCEVAGVDLAPDRCDLAGGFGAFATTTATGREATAALLAGEADPGFDCVILTAGTKDSGPVELAAEISRDRGTVVVVGDVGLAVPRAPFYEKELQLRLSRSYGPGRYDPVYEELAIDYPIGYVRWTEQRNMAEFVRLLAEKRIDVKPLITHRFTVDEAADAYAVVADPEQPSLGVLLEYPESEERARIEIGVGKTTTRRSAVRGDRVGVGLLGAGNFATATLLPALSKDPRFVPRGIFTASGLSARDVGERHGFAYCAGSASEIVDDSQTDAVVLATRHSSHAELAVAGLRAGKAVFVEKPLAITEQQLSEVVAAQRETGGRLMVGFNRRFAPLTRKVLDALKDRPAPLTGLIRVNAGQIAPTHWIQRVEEGGGRIIGEVCHFIDLACCLAGCAPEQVFALSADPGKSPVLTDSLTINLKFADKSVVSIVYAASGDTSYAKERVEVFCAGKVMVIDDFRSATLTTGGKTRTARLQGRDKGHRAEMKAFLDVAAGKPCDVLTFADCVTSTAATFKVIESLTTGLPVAVPRVIRAD
jgi:predicted dehydrogenase/threonine dehydrogenase-like Zn-dependent dehydrogenase